MKRFASLLGRRKCVSKRALEVMLHRRGDFGDQRQLGHGEGAVHRVDGAHHGFVQRLVGSLQPGFDGVEVTRHFRLEDFEQHRVDRRHFDAIVRGLGNGNLKLCLCLGCCIGLCGCCVVLHRVDRSGLDLGLGSEFDANRQRHSNDFLGLRLGRGHLRGGRRNVVRLFTCGKPVRHVLHGFQVGAHAALAAQRGVDFRKDAECGLHQCRDGRRGGDGVIEHAVEHALDAPGELSQGQRTDQTAAALERKENTPDRLELFEVGGSLNPERQEFAKILDFLFDLFHEDFADFFVDFLGSLLETAGDRTLFDFRHDVHRRRHRGSRRQGRRRLGNLRLNRSFPYRRSGCVEGHWRRSSLLKSRRNRYGNLFRLGQGRRCLMVGGGFGIQTLSACDHVLLRSGWSRRRLGGNAFWLGRNGRANLLLCGG